MLEIKKEGHTCKSKLLRCDTSYSIRQTLKMSCVLFKLVMTRKQKVKVHSCVAPDTLLHKVLKLRKLPSV